MEEEYVLGTNDDEISRLGVQHRVWRRRALDAWIDAGFTSGQTLLDIGSGPGWATLDLSEIAGASGSVIALEKSQRFLDALRSRQLPNVRAIELDLDGDSFPDLAVDGAWVRWVFAFVTNPRNLLRRTHAAMKPGAPLVIHEYFDYSTWRITPRSEFHENFVTEVMSSWRANGGEPNIGLDLLRWLPEEGFRVRRVRPLIDIITPAHFAWQWARSFALTGPDRLADLGRITAEHAAKIKDAFLRSESAPDTQMVTPGVVELIAEAV